MEVVIQVGRIQARESIKLYTSFSITLSVLRTLRFLHIQNIMFYIFYGEAITQLIYSFFFPLVVKPNDKNLILSMVSQKWQV